MKKITFKKTTYKIKNGESSALFTVITSLGSQSKPLLHEDYNSSVIELIRVQNFEPGEALEGAYQYRTNLATAPASILEIQEEIRAIRIEAEQKITTLQSIKKALHHSVESELTLTHIQPGEIVICENDLAISYKVSPSAFDIHKTKNML